MSVYRSHLTSSSRKTGTRGPANPAYPSSSWIGLSAKVTPRGRSAPVRPARASTRLSAETRDRFFLGPQAGQGEGRQHCVTRATAPPEAPGGTWVGAGATTLEEPLPAHAGSKPRPNRRRAPSPHPPAPNPIRGWHRLSNRLTNAAPPIAGRPGRGLRYQASLRGPTFKSLKLFQLRARPRFAGVEGHLVGYREHSFLYHETMGQLMKLCLSP